MALRVTQSMLYSSSLSGMNRTLSALMDSNIQSASQLRINKPSDDPVGAGRVINYRATLNNISRYQENISTAQGWLSAADGVLSSEGSAQTLLTRIKTLAQQGASETYDAENRKQIAYELRQEFSQLVNVANTTYNGKHIFSGQKTDSPAYTESLAATCKDSGALDGMTFTAEGGTDYTVIIQALSTDTAENAAYRYSEDGGSSWIDVPASDVTSNSPQNGKVRITAGGVSVIMDMGTQVNAVDTTNDQSGDNGTWLYVRPTAVYQGDDNDTQAVLPYGSGTNSAAEVSASGYFTRDVALRVDDVSGGVIQYSYSLDDGATWTGATCNAASPAKLAVPGGYLDLANQPATGEQYVIHPHRAEINLSISATDSVALNLVGKEVFGGLYADPATGELEVVENNGNIFEVVGKLIAAMETNDTDGIGQALDDLQDCMNVVLTKAATVGGRENRLTMTSSALTTLQYAEEDALSAVEDVDVSELMIRLAQQQVAYNSVLKSSSMIMQMSLVNFL